LRDQREPIVSGRKESIAGLCIFYITLLLLVSVCIYWLLTNGPGEDYQIRDTEGGTLLQLTATTVTTPSEDGVKKTLHSTSAPRRKTFHVGTSSGEQATRLALERLFGMLFVKVRPSFLVNPETGRRLELDCFNADLSLAVEYSGVQHYNFPNAFHKSIEQFQAQQRRDCYTADICRVRGIHLITVPFTVKNANIETFLRAELENKGFTLGICSATH